MAQVRPVVGGGVNLRFRARWGALCALGSARRMRWPRRMGFAAPENPDRIQGVETCHTLVIGCWIP